MNEIKEKEKEDDVLLEKYSFISLYLFILLFFIILSRIISSNDVDKKENLNRFLTNFSVLYETRNKQDGNYDQSSNASFYADKSSQSNISDSVSIKDYQKVKESRKVEWKDVFDDNGDVKQEFKDTLDEIIDYTSKTSGLNKSPILLIPSSDDSEIYSNTVKIMKYTSSLLSADVQFQFENNSEENVLRILIISQ